MALGAGVQAGIEMGQDMDSVLVDITPYTFGTSALGELYGMPYAHQFFPIIRRNTKLPTTRTEAFFTVTEAQQAVEIKVYQGEDPDALKNVEIGTFLISGLNEQPEAFDQGLLFTYHLDLDGLLKVHAVERATGREIRGVVEKRHGALHRGGPHCLQGADRGGSGARRKKPSPGAPRGGRGAGRESCPPGCVGGDSGYAGAGRTGARHPHRTKTRRR